VVKKCHPPVTLCTAACSINAASWRNIHMVRQQMGDERWCWISKRMLRENPELNVVLHSETGALSIKL
jgi:hypothetical protein